VQVVGHATGKRLKIRDDQLNAPLLHHLCQVLDAFAGPRRFQQVGHNCLPVANLVAHVGQVQTVNFCDLKVGFQITQTAVERNHMHPVALLLEVSDDFFGAGGMP
jgi:hypothetical protein